MYIKFKFSNSNENNFITVAFRTHVYDLLDLFDLQERSECSSMVGVINSFVLCYYGFIKWLYYFHLTDSYNVVILLANFLILLPYCRIML